jgi:hypothetical protein
MPSVVLVSLDSRGVADFRSRSLYTIHPQVSLVSSSGTMAKKLSTDEFIAKARAVHGNRYDYSESQYTTKRQLITFKCFEHGAVMKQNFPDNIADARDQADKAIVEKASDR